MPNSNFMSDANATAIFTAYATAIKLGLKAWIGTTAEWNQLTDVQKKQYQVNFKTDDCSEESIEIVKRSIADDFSTSVNYAVGDFCYHLGTLYKCTTAHTAGAWNATHFSATQVGDEIGELKNTIIDQTAGETFIIVTSLMPLFHDSINYSGYVSFPFVTKNDNYTVTLNGVIQNNVGDVTNNTTVTVKKNIGFAFTITGTYDYSKCGASINCVITFA